MSINEYGFPMSMLWNDLYKFTMQQFVLHQCSDAHAKYVFKCRNPHTLNGEAISAGKVLVNIAEEIERAIEMMCLCRFQNDELDYMKGLRFVKPDYVDFLEDFTLKNRYVKVDVVDDELTITIEGPMLQTILFEVPVLAIVHHLYSKDIFSEEDLEKHYEQGRVQVKNKIAMIHNYLETSNGTPFRFVDFGTRRAFTMDWHEQVVKMLTEDSITPISFVGTSNVYLAKKYNLTAIGTMAHELIMAYQQMDECSILNSQKYVLKKWIEEYQGDLGIALSDTLGIKKFLKDFDLYMAKLYDGVRQDSGNPFDFVKKIISHYKKLNINPLTKTVIFSDGLNFEKAFELNDYCNNKIKCSFGIGTNLTNSVGIIPLQNVIKMVELNGKPVAKISEDVGKTMCLDKNYLNYLKGNI